MIERHTNNPYGKTIITKSQIAFLEYCITFHLNELEAIERARIENGIETGVYREDGKRTITYNMCRKKWLTEYKEHKKING